MKDYKEVKLPKGLVGYESETGHGGWWYPSKENPLTMPINATCEHLHLWKNQGDMVVFAVPRCVFRPEELFEKMGRKQYVAVWFYSEDIDEIVNKTVV